MTSNGSQLKEEHCELRKQAEHLVDAIAKHGFSSLLSTQLATVESRLAEVERLMTTKPRPKLPAFSEEQIKKFLRQENQNFCEVLVSDPETARREIQKRITKLVLTPKETADGTVLEVSGDVELFRGGGVMLERPLEEFDEHYIPFAVSLSGLQLDPRASV